MSIEPKHQPSTAVFAVVSESWRHPGMMTLADLSSLSGAAKLDPGPICAAQRKP
jgi:hypothetical protein